MKHIKNFIQCCKLHNNLYIDLYEKVIQLPRTQYIPGSVFMNDRVNSIGLIVPVLKMISTRDLKIRRN